MLYLADDTGGYECRVESARVCVCVCYLGRLVDSCRSECDWERDIDWHMSYTVTVR